MPDASGTIDAARLARLREQLTAGVMLTDADALRVRSRDWWPLSRLREVRGDVLDLPAAVVLPRSTEEVATVLRWCNDHAVTVIARGLGSGVCGGAAPLSGCVVLETSAMDQIIALDEISHVVTVQAGLRGDRLEAYLASFGLTTGHYPQSINVSTVGGWIAASGAGQATPGYGPIEQRVAGLTVVLPDGTISRIRPMARAASGPDLRKLVLGSEGQFGVVTEAVLICANITRETSWQTFVYPDYDAAIAAGRDTVRSGAGARVLRAWDEPDSARAFGPLGLPSGCLGMVGIASDAPGLDGRQAAVAKIAATYAGVPANAEWGPHWWAHRLDAVELFETVMGPRRVRGDGIVLDTLEVQSLWADLPSLHRTVGAALRRHTDEVRAHYSHVYHIGASLYFTFVIKGVDDFSAEATYREAWAEAMQAAIDANGSISHHHGIGRQKAAFLEPELGSGAFRLLKMLKSAIDPKGILNPGVLIPLT